MTVSAVKFQETTGQPLPDTVRKVFLSAVQSESDIGVEHAVPSDMVRMNIYRLLQREKTSKTFRY